MSQSEIAKLFLTVNTKKNTYVYHLSGVAKRSGGH